MIKAKGISKSFGDLKVLKGLDFQAEKGELVSIVGASGAGKTTFLQILGTLENPDQGELYIKDTAVFKLKPKKLAQFRNDHIGFIFQFHHLLPEFTAIENVCIPGFIAKKKKGEVEKRAAELLNYLGLKERVNHKPSELSGGEQQRVAVARALINNPALVLADEPTGNLDSKNALALHELFMELKTEFQQSFVIVTHNKELSKISDNQLFMKDGIFQ